MSNAGYDAGYGSFAGVPSSLVHSERLLQEGRSGADGLRGTQVVVLDTSGHQPVELLRTTQPERVGDLARQWRQEPAPQHHEAAPLASRADSGRPAQISLHQPAPPADDTLGHGG
jgi:hypothetical protein